jgi:cytochrome c oxidase cbb3-type subunit 2
MHFAAAVVAGYLLDRGWLGRTVLVATAMLLLAGWLIVRNGHPMATGALIYIGAVSFYSTALVFFPARSARADVAAMMYAVAGWGGSALGISLVDGMPTVPGWFWAVAGGVVAMALVARALIGRGDGAAGTGKSN